MRQAEWSDAYGVSFRSIPILLLCGGPEWPPHVHVERDFNKAKFWLQPVDYESSVGFSRGELMDIYRLIFENQPLLLECWNGYLSD